MNARTYWYVLGRNGKIKASTHSPKESYKLKLEPGDSLHRVDYQRVDLVVEYKSDDPAFDKRAKEVLAYRESLIKPMKDALIAFEKNIDNLLITGKLPIPKS